jgi:PAS domain S-box-containing protein
MHRTITHTSEYASSLIEASLDPLITINTDGEITDMNEAFIKITGETRKSLTGTDFGVYFTDPENARKIYKEVFEKGFVTNYPLTVIDGELTDVLFNGSVYKDAEGTVLGAVVVARDITGQNIKEKELIAARVFAEEARSVAEDEKGKAESATRIAEDAVNAKQQFLSNMSHEIRTPLNAIIGFAKVVSKTSLSIKQKEYISAIQTSGDTLIMLINDILDLAKVDAGKMTFEETPFKMASFLSAMLHFYETKIQDKDLVFLIEYDNSIPDILIGDKSRLHQIILNLISNAEKFTVRGEIKVAVKLLYEIEGIVTIEFLISDTGIGIAIDKLEAIFENFQQASSGTSRLYGGTGLGLAIVKHLVEAQGGSIGVTSTVGEGSVFSFTLGFKKATMETVMETDVSESVSDLKNIKVLVVEDITLNQLLMKTILDDFNFECDIASNGKIAIEMLLHKTYDIILMDIQMPVMDGFEATEYIRNTLKSEICIIALTADVTTLDIHKCKAAGMNDYIAKPIDETLLYSKIVGLLKSAGVEKSAVQVLQENMIKGPKYINMDYLTRRTRSNPKLIAEMISLYLEQTPPLISLMKKSFVEKDWVSLYAAVHKMIPSFLIVGMHADFENIAKKIQGYATRQNEGNDIQDLVLQLENVCTQACRELEEELEKIKKN